MGMNIEQFISSGFVNLEAYEEMYEKFLKDPSSVDASWKQAFSNIDSVSLSSDRYPAPKPLPSSAGDLRVYHLIHAYRTYGHLYANYNPLNVSEKEEPYQLNFEMLGFHPDELDKDFPTGGVMEQERAPLREIISTLKEIYCGKIGIEYMGIDGPELEWWLQQHIEPTRFRIQLSIDDKKMILQHLNRSELFELFLHTKYVGQKRFSLEGGETLIPILNALIEYGSHLGIESFVLGMAHRGRLNVLSNILDKSYSTIFSEFEESYIPDSFEGSGDVKYHKGFSSERETSEGKKVHIQLSPNPSHLEAVNPVVEGEVKAKQVLLERDGEQRVVPILIHGDAALAGQGIVYETMQFSKLPGYSTGGTIHIVINNQIGFTTLPEDSRSTKHCTDIAKTFGAPIFHVNAEDPESCIYAIHLAVDIRQRFHKDVFIDLNCYRKYGHNEGDEPSFTQPIEYQMIKKKKPIREIYRDDLIQQGVLEKYMAEQLEEEFKHALNEALKGTKHKIEEKKNQAIPKQPEISNLFTPVETGVASKKLVEAAELFCRIPENLQVHKKLQSLVADRLEMAHGSKPVDWGMGEMLAYATLLKEGDNVRISGQDCCRGTFSHRHALWIDQESGDRYVSLKNLHSNQGRFDVYNSPLSEYGVLGFEYGYSLEAPQGLTIWEAQFGDFCNGAQIIIDQFIATSEQKWGKKSGITLLLPHGYEGQGPEHSSARMERFLTLAGDNNMFIVNPTSPVQFFHLLRRQVKSSIKKPLIVFTPKGLLRHPLCQNAIEEFSKGAFEEIIDDPSPPKKVKRIALCSGRVYYDLIQEREKVEESDLAIIRIEQLYPLNADLLKETLNKYKEVEQLLWVQEEPKNMGPWSFIQHMIPSNKPLKYVGRERSASPAAGSFGLHKKEHAAIMHDVFNPRKTEQDS